MMVFWNEVAISFAEIWTDCSLGDGRGMHCTWRLRDSVRAGWHSNVQERDGSGGSRGRLHNSADETWTQRVGVVPLAMSGSYCLRQPKSTYPRHHEARFLRTANKWSERCGVRYRVGIGPSQRWLASKVDLC